MENKIELNNEILDLIDQKLTKYTIQLSNEIVDSNLSKEEKIRYMFMSHIKILGKLLFISEPDKCKLRYDDACRWLQIIVSENEQLSDKDFIRNFLSLEDELNILTSIKQVADEEIAYDELI